MLRGSNYVSTAVYQMNMKVFNSGSRSCWWYITLIRPVTPHWQHTSTLTSNLQDWKIILLNKYFLFFPGVGWEQLGGNGVIRLVDPPGIIIMWNLASFRIPRTVRQSDMVNFLAAYMESFTAITRPQRFSYSTGWNIFPDLKWQSRMAEEERREAWSLMTTKVVSWVFS